jgi:hypothetical protein
MTGSKEDSFSELPVLQVDVKFSEEGPSRHCKIFSSGNRRHAEKF